MAKSFMLNLKKKSKVLLHILDLTTFLLTKHCCRHFAISIASVFNVARVTLQIKSWWTNKEQLQIQVAYSLCIQRLSNTYNLWAIEVVSRLPSDCKQNPWYNSCTWCPGRQVWRHWSSQPDCCSQIPWHDCVFLNTFDNEKMDFL